MFKYLQTFYTIYTADIPMLYENYKEIKKN